MATEAVENEQVEIDFLIKWILVSTLIWILLSLLGFGLDFLYLKSYYQSQTWLPGDYENSPYFLEHIRNIVMVLVVGVIGGAIGGITQWIVLRLRLPPLSSWICFPIWVWSTIMGYSLGVYFIDWVQMSSGDQLIKFLGIALTGVHQWYILRRYVTKASWWLIVTPIGSILTFISMGFLSWLKDIIPFNFMDYVKVGAIGGVFLVLTSIGPLKLIVSKSSRSEQSDV